MKKALIKSLILFTFFIATAIKSDAKCIVGITWLDLRTGKYITRHFPLDNSCEEVWVCMPNNKCVDLPFLIKDGEVYSESPYKAILKIEKVKYDLASDKMENALSEQIKSAIVKKQKIDIDKFIKQSVDKKIDMGIISKERLFRIAERFSIPFKEMERKSLRGTAFEEKKDFVWSDPLLMKTLGYESITFQKGIYKVSNEGAVTLNIIATGKAFFTPTENFIRVPNSGTKQYRGFDCFLFGFSCCVYDKVLNKDNEPVDYQFALKDGKAVTLTIQFRGTGSPKAQGF